MTGSLNYGELNGRLKALAHDKSPEAIEEFDELLEQLVTMDMGLQSTRRAMSRSQLESKDERKPG